MLHKYDIPAIRQVQRQERDFEEVGALSPQQQQDIPRVMEIAKKFGLEIHFIPHGLIHLNQWRPRAFETFAQEFLRRINAEFVADGDFAGGVIKLLGLDHTARQGLQAYGVGPASRNAEPAS